MSNFRQNVRSGLYQLLVGWLGQGSNSQIVRQAYDHRPPAFDPPILFVGEFVEQFNHDHQIRNRDFRVDVYMVRTLYDNQEQLRLSDVAVDSLTDHLSAEWHGITANSLQEPIAVRDVPIDVGGVRYFATVLTVRAMLEEGRPT